MAKAKALHLFYGNDSLASSAELARWEERFRLKYGEGTRYVIHADELDPAVVADRLTATVRGQSLFTQPQFIILKRLTGADRGSARPGSSAVLPVIEKLLPFLGAEVILVVWEERSLSTSHPLLKRFTVWQENAVAQIHRYSVPDARTVRTAATAYLSERGATATPGALAWLQREYSLREQLLRATQQRKREEELTEDDRSWWLRQLLDTALLLAPHGNVDEAVLQASGEVGTLPVSAFQIQRALEQRAWGQARQLLSAYEQAADDEAAYYLLYGALRWGWQRHGGEVGRYALRLLGEIEVVVKNGLLPHAWLLDLFVDRLAVFSLPKSPPTLLGARPLLSGRALWLTSL